eukprot:1903450-Lingulodinium_polyedra.AAC.1
MASCVRGARGHAAQDRAAWCDPPCCRHPWLRDSSALAETIGCAVRGRMAEHRSGCCDIWGLCQRMLGLLCLEAPLLMMALASSAVGGAWSGFALYANILAACGRAARWGAA